MPKEPTTPRTGAVNDSGLTTTSCPCRPNKGALCQPYIGSGACIMCPHYQKHTHDRAAGTVTVDCEHP